MAKYIHISTARHMLDKPDPVDLAFWTKDGSLIELKDCVPLSYNFRSGTQYQAAGQPPDPHHQRRVFVSN